MILLLVSLIIVSAVLLQMVAEEIAKENENRYEGVQGVSGS